MSGNKVVFALSKTRMLSSVVFLLFFFSRCEILEGPDMECTARINGTLWKASYKRFFAGGSEAFFITNFISGDSILFEFTGEIEGDSYRQIDIKFVIKDFQVDRYQKMGVLKKKFSSLMVLIVTQLSKIGKRALILALACIQVE